MGGAVLTFPDGHPQIRLDNAPDNFERGKVDCFSVRGPDLAEVSCATLVNTFDTKREGARPSWLCARVVIENKTRGWKLPLFPEARALPTTRQQPPFSTH